VGRFCSYRHVSHVPLSYEDGVPVFQKFLGTLYMRTRDMKKSNEILHGDQTSTVSITPPAWKIIFVTRMMTRDLFAVANFRVLQSSDIT